MTVDLQAKLEAETLVLTDAVMMGLAAHLVKNRAGTELKIDLVSLALSLTEIAGLALASADISLGGQGRRDLCEVLRNRIETVMEDERSRGLLSAELGHLAAQLIERQTAVADIVKAVMGGEKPELNA